MMSKAKSFQQAFIRHYKKALEFDRLHKRRFEELTVKVLEDCTLKQKNLARHILSGEDRFISLIAARRAGKSWGCDRAILLCALAKMRTNGWVITRRKGVTKQYYWGRLQNLLTHYGVPFRTNAADLTLFLPWNEGMIRLGGADDRSEMEMYRGGSNSYFFIDESSTFHPDDLSYFVHDVIKWSLVDQMGPLVMYGTPGEIHRGEWYDASYHEPRENSQGVLMNRNYGDEEETRDAIWVRHHWLPSDNTFVPHLEEEYQADRKKRGWDENHPTFLREARGIWSTNAFGMVYRWNEVSANDEVYWDPDMSSSQPFGLPEGHEWRFILAIDTGWVNPTSFTIGAWAFTHPQFFYCYNWARGEDTGESGMRTSEIADKIRELQDKVSFTKIVGDMGPERRKDFLEKHSLYIEAPEKSAKADHQKLWNDDLLDGRLRFMRDMEPWFKEMEILPWDTGSDGLEVLDRTGKMRENPKFPNDRCDTGLYAWRMSYYQYREVYESFLDIHKFENYSKDLAGYYKKYFPGKSFPKPDKQNVNVQIYRNPRRLL